MKIVNTQKQLVRGKKKLPVLQNILQRNKLLTKYINIVATEIQFIWVKKSNKHAKQIQTNKILNHGNLYHLDDNNNSIGPDQRCV
jgi:hypothetical protein